MVKLTTAELGKLQELIGNPEFRLILDKIRDHHKDEWTDNVMQNFDDVNKCAKAVGIYEGWKEAFNLLIQYSKVDVASDPDKEAKWFVSRLLGNEQRGYM